MESRRSTCSAGEWEEECGGKIATRVSGVWRAAGAIAAQVSGNSYAEKDTWYALRCKILQISKKNYRKSTTFKKKIMCFTNGRKNAKPVHSPLF